MLLLGRHIFRMFRLLVVQKQSYRRLKDSSKVCYCRMCSLIGLYTIHNWFHYTGCKQDFLCQHCRLEPLLKCIKLNLVWIYNSLKNIFANRLIDQRKNQMKKLDDIASMRNIELRLYCKIQDHIALLFMDQQLVCKFNCNPKIIRLKFILNNPNNFFLLLDQPSLIALYYI